MAALDIVVVAAGSNAANDEGPYRLDGRELPGRGHCGEDFGIRGAEPGLIGLWWMRSMRSRRSREGQRGVKLEKRIAIRAVEGEGQPYFLEGWPAGGFVRLFG